MTSSTTRSERSFDRVLYDSARLGKQVNEKSDLWGARSLLIGSSRRGRSHEPPTKPCSTQ
jgi:hypothetical protein